MEPSWDTAIEETERLLDLLEQQGEALRDRDPDRVGRLAARMSPLVRHLDQVGRSLASLPDAASAPARERLTRLLQLCRRLNADNGNRIAALERHQRRALALLCADPGGSPLYGPQGDQRGIRLSRYTARA